MIVLKPKTPEEMGEIIAKTVGEGRAAITSVAGVLVVEDKKLAVATFLELVGRLAREMEKDIVITGFLDAHDRHGIGADPDEVHGIRLYGVAQDEYFEHKDGPRNLN